MTAASFVIWIDEESVRVRFVSQRALGRLRSGHLSGGDYGDRIIRLPRRETRGAARGALLHELGHYLVDRQELRASNTTEEEVCDLLAWLPAILADPRNEPLRKLLGLRLA